MGTTQSTQAPLRTDTLTKLPVDVTLRVASFLLGADLLPLAHASPVCFAMLREAAATDDRHRCHTTSASSWRQEKAIYLHRRALVFGRDTTWTDRLRSLTSSRGRNDDSVALPPGILDGVNRFTVELTFRITPTAPGATTCHGGILFGFQSEPRSASVQPTSFVALVSIDANGGLRSVTSHMNAPTRVVTHVSFTVWHHVVLTYDGQYVRAYLDSALRYFKRMPRGFDRETLRHGQIGTGFGYDPNRSPATYDNQRLAWRPFHGHVVQARVWASASSEYDARVLAQGDGRVSQRPLFTVCGDSRHATRVVSLQTSEQKA